MSGRHRRSPAPGNGTVAASALALSVQYAIGAAGLPVRSTVRRWASAALDRPAAVTVRFAGAREGRVLNASYRGKDHATNVLTFVYDDVDPLAGDLVLCVPVIRREAREQRITFTAHCAHLVVHGMLHLQGFDHERPREAARMEAREARILAGLGYADPYVSRAPLPPAR
jgi:probable rRNA maturation factor